MSDERLLHRLPLPLAQLLRRALTAPSGAERHNNAYFLAEAMLKLSAAARIGVWLDRALVAGSEVAQGLEALSLPSTGHWLSFLRDVDVSLAERRDAALLPLGNTLGRLGRACEWPAVEELAAAAEDTGVVSREVRSKARTGLLGFFGLVVAYRNAVVGHGGQRLASFYERMAPLWLAALTAVLSEEAFLGGMALAVPHTRLSGDGRPVLHWLDLTGTAGYPLDQPPSDAARLGDGSAPAAGRLYLVGPGALVPLHPLLVFREDELGNEAVGFLNKTVRRTKGARDDKVEEVRRADYLNYTTGDALPGNAPTDELTALLARLRGRPVSESALRAVVDATAAISAADPIDTVSAGACVGGFELLEEIGRGGMGIVYRARQIAIGRIVALKVLPPGLASDAEAAARFRREVIALARADHPNIVKVLTYGVDQDRHHFAMEFVEGSDLSRVGRQLSGWRSTGAALQGEHIDAAVVALHASSRSGKHDAAPAECSGDAEAAEPRPSQVQLATGESTAAPVLATGRSYYAELARLFAGAADGLHHLHQRGIVHRDVKPGNLMLTLDGSRLVVMDLGLASLSDASRALTGSQARLLGTLRYMPPEQLMRSAGPVDGRADVYALGASLYELVTGKALLEGETEAELVHQAIAGDTAPARRIDKRVPRDLETVLAKATARNRMHRYGTAADFADDLRAFAAGHPIKAAPPSIFRRTGASLRRHPTVSTALVSLTLVAPAATGVRWWWTTDHVYYCAAVSYRWAAPECVGNLSTTEHRQREQSYEFHKSRGRVTRVVRVNGHGLPRDELLPLQGGTEELLKSAEARASAVRDRATSESPVVKEPAAWDYAYRDDGKVTGITLWSRTGQFLGREVHSPDLERVELRGPDGTPRRFSGTTDVWVTLRRFDARGFLIREVYQNLYATPREGPSKAYGFEIEVDASGLPVKLWSLGEDGQRARDGAGILSRTVTRDGEGRIASQRWQGVSAANSAGREARSEYRYSAQGNLIERSLSGLPGAASPSNVAYNRVEHTHDAHGNRTATMYFTDSRPALGPGGAHRVEYSYDDFGREKERRYIGLDGKPRPRTKDGHTREAQRFDARGNVVEIAYSGEGGRPVPQIGGYVRWTSTYDERGNQTEEAKWDAQGHLLGDNQNIARTIMTYNARDEEIHRVYLGADNRPVVVARKNYSKRMTRYDDRGNVVERAFFGPNDEPVVAPNGGHRWKAIYDERGNLLEDQKFDTEGKLMLVAEHYARVTYQYDSLGRITRKDFWGVDGKPILFEGSDKNVDRGGYASRAYRYDGHGNEIERAFLGLDDKPIDTLNGYAFIRRKYAANGSLEEEAFFDAQGRPTMSLLGKQSYARRVYRYAPSGELVTIEDYDATGALLNPQTETR